MPQGIIFECSVARYRYKIKVVLWCIYTGVRKFLKGICCDISWLKHDLYPGHPAWCGHRFSLASWQSIAFNPCDWKQHFTTQQRRTTSFCTSADAPLEAFYFMNSQFARNVFRPAANQVYSITFSGEWEFKVTNVLLECFLIVINLCKHVSRGVRNFTSSGFD